MGEVPSAIKHILVNHKITKGEKDQQAFFVICCWFPLSPYSVNREVLSSVFSLGKCQTSSLLLSSHSGLLPLSTLEAMCRHNVTTWNRLYFFTHLLNAFSSSLLTCSEISRMGESNEAAEMVRNGFTGWLSLL